MTDETRLKLERMVVYIVVFVSGGVSMAFEILGSRVLAPDFGSTIFVWGSLISVFLGALCLGYGLGGRLSERAHSLTVLGALTAAPAVLLLLFPYYGFWISGYIFDLDIGERFGPLLASTCLFFLPTIFFGAVSPVAVSLMTNARQGVGRSAGDVFAVSTTGSILGTLGTSFFLILWIGTKACVLLLGGLMLALALTAFGFRVLTRR
jgi:hypothetical protein